MLDVTVKMDRFGLGTEITTLAALRIWNDGTGTHEFGNYGWALLDKRMRPYRKGSVKNWPRTRRPVFRLVMECLKQAYPPAPARSDSGEASSSESNRACWR